MLKYHNQSYTLYLNVINAYALSDTSSILIKCEQRFEYPSQTKMSLSFNEIDSLDHWKGYSHEILSIPNRSDLDQYYDYYQD